MAPLLPESGDVAESGHEVAGAELEHKAAVAKAMGVPRLELAMPCNEAMEVPRLELPMLSDEAAVVELEAVMRSMESCAGVRREMAEAAAAIARLGGLRRHRRRGQQRSDHHDLAHLPRSLIGRLCDSST